VEEASLPEPVIGPLKRYAEVLDVRVVAGVHDVAPAVARLAHVSDGLGDAGLDDDAIERVRAGAPDLIVAAEHDLDAPKPLTTDGARSIMERLWTHDVLAERRDELDLSLNGDYRPNCTAGGGASGKCLFDSSATPLRPDIWTTAKNRCARPTNISRPPSAPTWRPRRSRRRTIV